MSGAEMRAILRKCRVLYGAADSFRTFQFEKLMELIECDYTTCRPTGKPVHFLKLGDRTNNPCAVNVPKEMYSLDGALEKLPIAAVHLPGVRTKVSRRLASNLIEASTEIGNAQHNDPKEPMPNNVNNKGSMTIYINDLMAEVKKEIMCASRQGPNYAFTQCAERHIRKAAAIAVKGALRDMVEAWVDRMGDVKEAEACLSTPVSNGLTNNWPEMSALRQRLVFPLEEKPGPVNDGQVGPLITPPVDLTDDVEEDEQDVDIALSQIKEETILQNLLHKRLTTKKNERVLTLEHKNGRKFRLILPPDT